MVQLPAPHEDPFILKQLALMTFRAKMCNVKDELIEARDLLKILNPDTSNDTETLGL